MTYLCTFIYAFLVIACKKKETKCNCDTDDGEIGIDEGDLRTTDHLPVMKIVNTNAQRGSSTLGLGEFECFGDESKFALSQAACRPGGGHSIFFWRVRAARVSLKNEGSGEQNFGNFAS